MQRSKLNRWPWLLVRIHPFFTEKRTLFIRESDHCRSENAPEEISFPLPNSKAQVFITAIQFKKWHIAELFSGFIDSCTFGKLTNCACCLYHDSFRTQQFYLHFGFFFWHYPSCLVFTPVHFLPECINLHKKWLVSIYTKSGWTFKKLFHNIK